VGGAPELESAASELDCSARELERATAELEASSTEAENAAAADEDASARLLEVCGKQSVQSVPGAHRGELSHTPSSANGQVSLHRPSTLLAVPDGEAALEDTGGRLLEEAPPPLEPDATPASCGVLLSVQPSPRRPSITHPSHTLRMFPPCPKRGGLCVPATAAAMRQVGRKLALRRERPLAVDAVEQLPPPQTLAALAAPLLAVTWLLVRAVMRALNARSFRARAAMDTNEFVAAMPQAGRDRAHRRIALAVRSSVAQHTRLPEECIYPTDLMGALAGVRGKFSVRAVQRGMEAQLGKKVNARGSDALAPLADQTLSAFINQVARGAEVVE
jgi:hypothetical protein